MKSQLRYDGFPNGCLKTEQEIAEFFKNHKSDYPCHSCSRAPRVSCIDRFQREDGFEVIIRKHSPWYPGKYQTR